MSQIENHPLYRKHTIDTAINSLWDFYKTRFISLFLISLGMSLAIQYASTFVNLKELQAINDPMVMLEKIKEYLVPIVVILLINLLFSAILQYYIIYNPIDSSATIPGSIFNGFRYYIPFLVIMVILSLVASIAIVLGLLALIIGVFFSMIYVVMLYLFILPILMVEGPNIANTISRTVALGHRNFWSNIGWVAVFIILFIVISLILSGIILIPFTGSFLKSIVNPEEAEGIVDVTTKPLFLILSAVVNAITLPLVPIFACILYFNGRAGEAQAQNIITNEPENRIRVEDLYAKPWSDNHPDNPENKT